MKKTIFFVLTLAFFISCRKQPSACINGPLSVEEGQDVTYTSCSENEDKIEWRFGSERSHEKSFTPVFKSRGLNTLELNIKNGDKQDTKTIKIEYGKSSKTICSVLDGCSTSISNQQDVANYKAYLYDSKSDWVMDVKNKSHSLVIDSTSCEYSPSGATGIANFKKTIPTGSTKIVSVEYRNPSNPLSIESNWGSLVSDNDGLISITNGDYSDNYASTRLNRYAKKLLSGKWFLTSAIINNQPTTLPPCMKDDFLWFFGDGTWVFDIGNDNCSGASKPSIGTFSGLLNSCDQPVYISITTESGPFVVYASTFNDNTLVVNFGSGSTTGSYTFTLQP